MGVSSRQKRFHWRDEKQLEQPQMSLLDFEK